MSGMAIEAPRIPGSIATFATCSSAMSSRSDAIIFSEAKMMPSTRIPGLYDLGMRHLKSVSFSRGPDHPVGMSLCSSRQRSEEHTSELQSHFNLVCRLLLEKKN